MSGALWGNKEGLPEIEMGALVQIQELAFPWPASARCSGSVAWGGESQSSWISPQLLHLPP